jgi:CheY-like chemotaxis protein
MSEAPHPGDHEAALHQLREANRRKDQFLALLAHELRSPLAPLLNALHVLRLRGLGAQTDAERGSPDPAADQALDLAERQVHHLARLVDDLLDVSRIASAKMALRKEWVRLETLVHDATETVRPLMETHGLRLTVLLPPEPLRLEADPARVTQVLINLLTNAAKYTEPGGHVWLTAERDEDEVLIRVRDTGVGLAADLLPHVFDLFFQAERGAQGGLGIGLSLVRGLVELHGGSVLAFSEGPGEGSEFVVRLPAPPEVGPACRAGPAKEVPPGRRDLPRRVLVVDDDLDAAESLAMLLRLWGHEVRVAHDGLAALEVAAGWKPEVVLLDITLSGGPDGYEIARRLRSEAGLTDAVLMALTGWGQEEDRRRSEAAGFQHHLVKPVDPNVLRALVAGS